MIGLHEVAASILLVEDNRAEAELLLEYLGQSDPATRVAHVSTLREGLARLQVAPVDVVVLDLTLPDAQGVDTVLRLRDVREELPILVLTGAEDETLALECIEAGASDYLFKSELRPQSLRRAIGYAMGRRREAQVRELTATLIRLKRLATSDAQTTVTATMAGVGPLRVQHPQAFQRLSVEYLRLFEDYLGHVIFDGEKPALTMEQMTTRLGDLGAGPRDLIDLHVAAFEVEMSTEGRNRNQGHARILEGRMLALEMMGLLVDYYRSGHRRRSLKEERA